MEQITGQRSMSAKSLMKYFEPLTKWLTEQNADGDDIGWGEECPDPVSVETDVNKAKKWLENYNTKAQIEENKATIADWNYAANITDVNQQKQVLYPLHYCTFFCVRVLSICDTILSHFPKSQIIYDCLLINLFIFGTMFIRVIHSVPGHLA